MHLVEQNTAIATTSATRSTLRDISVAAQEMTTAPSSNVDSWWRTQSATMALLKHAQAQIEASEKLIAEQAQKIRELEDLASTDPMTALMNRRGFEKFFEQELSHIRRHNSSGALLLLIDLDKFKEINDTCGHQAGDTCLKLVAEKLLQSIRIVDGAARFGGDEFAILLTQTDKEKAAVRIEKIRAALDTLELQWEGKRIRFGASLGAASIDPQNGYMAAYEAADAALYADKKRRKGA